MSRASRSAAMTTAIDQVAREHLLRGNRQEDVCFAVYHPSRGRDRQTALISRLILPGNKDRNLHGNASIEPGFFQRAMAEATAEEAGLALMHSHPLGAKWQGMSLDDITTERSFAAAAFGATRMPFVGLTVAGDGSWSARFWDRIAPRTYMPQDCATVRVVGDRLSVTYMDRLAPPPKSNEEQVRTVSAWGEQSQADLVRLRVAVVGAGSVGGMIAEALARTGFEDITLIDFDYVERHNLDRLVYATRKDIGRLKVTVEAEHLSARATAEPFRVHPISAAVYEEEGLRAALDCDVIFSCVDRPWGRYVLNLIAYAHLIPVIDGGIGVRTNRFGKLVAADWRAHTATIGRRCLQCHKQYDPGLVQAEREGFLDDPTYIEGLQKGHPLKARENVFGFSMSCASMQMLQMLALTIAPLSLSNPGAQLYHFVGGHMETPQFESCHPECQFPEFTALGDASNIDVTGSRPVLQKALKDIPSCQCAAAAD